MHETTTNKHNNNDPLQITHTRDSSTAKVQTDSAY